MTCNHSNIKEVLTPNFVHYARLECIDCGKFLGWKQNPKSEGIRNKTSKHKIQDILTHKKFNRPFCFFCGRTKKMLGKKETLTIDHIVPIRDEGQNDIVNLQILCSACHKLRHWTELYTNKHLRGEDNA